MGALAVVALALGVAVLVAVLLAVLLARSGGERARTREQLAAAQAETAELRRRLDDVVARVERSGGTPAAADPPRAYLITDVGAEAARRELVPDGAVLSATVGEPLVKVAALAHGVRRALSPQSRNRIVFEVRREIRRARKQRRKETREAWRARQARDAA